MADNEMCFPETWEEFRKQYRIVDTEKVYTNGAEMIPTFRVKQWLDHVESVKRSQQSEQNKMKQVAELFGKKLGEPFTIYVPFYKCKNEAVFDVHGLSIKSYGDWDNNSGYLMWLLAGEAEIVEE